MAYGITNDAQIIDYDTIFNGCQAYTTALGYLKEAEQYILQAAEYCDKKTLEVDGETLQPALYDLAQQVHELYDSTQSHVEQVNTDAYDVLKEQKKELKAYYEQQQSDVPQYDI